MRTEALDLDYNGQEDDEVWTEGRIYLPPASQDSNEYLKWYVEREFPAAERGGASVYSVPKTFGKKGERQATLAEQEVFNRLGGMRSAEGQAGDLCGLWTLFFHGACYAGHSFRNRRVGRLMVREHDFVVFARFEGRNFVALLEVKSTNDHQHTHSGDLERSSDSKVVKNNKRSAQHQLRDHMEVLAGVLGDDKAAILSRGIQAYIVWPFLGALTKDPRQQPVRRWKDDGNLHVFEDVISDQDKFDRWFLGNVLVEARAVDDADFNTLLDRFIVLSCGVFVDEIDKGLVALLTQEQLGLLHNHLGRVPKGGALVVHGAAGTGKTLLVLRKLEQLHRIGQLNKDNRALVICYWPGIRCEIEQKLLTLGIKDFVDTVRFFISRADFLQDNHQRYRHIFMDEAEALCLAFQPKIIERTFGGIYKRYHDGNCTIADCPHSTLEVSKDLNKMMTLHSDLDDWGELWFLVDNNQAPLFLPKFSPKILKSPSFILTKVMRSTGYIFDAFLKQYYVNPVVSSSKSPISLGHHIMGPPVYWAETDDKIDKTVACVIVDLCSSKGFKPNDICVLPLIVSDKLHPESINKYMDDAFVENGFRPQGVTDVEYFLRDKELNEFLVPWALRVKGLEFKVVVIAIDEDDFDCNDMEDRKKVYIMSSRCTCMLILVSNRSTKNDIDSDKTFVDYPFSLNC